MPNNFYDVLKISKDASQQDIKDAYRRAAKEYHPDVNASPEAAEKMQAINEAYEILGDPERRKEYDTPARDFSRGVPNDFFSGWPDMAGFHNRTVRRNPTKQMQYAASIEDVINENTVNISYTKQYQCKDCLGFGGTEDRTSCTRCHGSGRTIQNQTIGEMTFTVDHGPCERCGGKGFTFISACQTCHGMGIISENVNKQIKLEAGCLTSPFLFLGEGDTVIPDLPPGDAEVFIALAPHKIYQFEPPTFNLHYVVGIDPVEAMVGTSLNIPLPEGGFKKITLKEGVPQDFVEIIQGSGLPYAKKSRGNLIVHLNFKIPSKLTDKQREALKTYLSERSETL